MQVSGYSIESAGPADVDSIADLHRRAFGGDKVPRLVEALRTHPTSLDPIERVARSADGQMVGHVMLSGCLLDAQERLVPVMTLSPLAVDERHRGRRIGSRLIKDALEIAAETCPLVFLEGNPRYYQQSGFRPAEPLGFRRPSLRIPEPAFQVAVLERYESWMKGTLVYSEPFWTLDCVGLR